MPLNWPPGWNRTSTDDRERGRFKRVTREESSYGGTYPVNRAITFSDALNELMQEIRRAGGSDLRIDHDGQSDVTGVPLKGKREPEDPGVVVRFRRAGHSYAIACDRYTDRAQNLRAIAKTIEATRGIERWGAVTGEQAFKGYEALPPPGGSTGTSAPIVPPRPPHDVLGVSPTAPPEVVKAAFRALVAARGQDADVTDLIAARDTLLKAA
jgi:hypothetical protein